MTLDQLSPEARRLLAKMARAAARDYFEGRQEAEEAHLQRVRDQGIERLSAQLVEECKRQMERERRRARQHAIDDAAEAAAEPPQGVCLICDQPWEPGQLWQPLQTQPGWMHNSPLCVVTPMMRKADVPAEQVPHVDQHFCATSQTWQNYCRASCSACMDPARAIPCPNIVGESSS